MRKASAGVRNTTQLGRYRRQILNEDVEKPAVHLTLPIFIFFAHYVASRCCSGKPITAASLVESVILCIGCRSRSTSMMMWPTVAKAMTSEQVVKAQRRAREWLEAHPEWAASGPSNRSGGERKYLGEFLDGWIGLVQPPSTR